MGGIVGATSGKFVLVAASLLLQGRLDNHVARIAIAPGSTTSAMSEAHADPLTGGRYSKSRVKIGLRAEYFYVDKLDIEPMRPDGVDLRIGQDILNSHPIEIDFECKTIRLLLPGEAAHAKKHMTAIIVGRAADDAITVPVYADGQYQSAVRLDLSATGDSPTSRFENGALHIDGQEKHRSLALGLSVFGHYQVIFDLGHSRIWLDQGRSHC